jgi:hypothetical protein
MVLPTKEYQECFKYYHNAMSIAQKHEDLHNNEILEFQHNADIFFWKWVDLESYNGMMNYIHLMGSGHLVRVHVSVPESLLALTTRLGEIQCPSEDVLLS